MTGYSITVGYNSAFHTDEVWRKLVDVVKAICAVPEQIIVEDGGNIPAEYAESYREPWQDLTIKIVDEEETQVVRQLASGGGEGREYKERMRRAFIRLVMKEMHKSGMEINVFVG